MRISSVFLLLLFFIFLSEGIFAVSGVTVQFKNDVATASLSEWKALINAVIGSAMFIGLISLIKAFVFNNPNARKVLIGWVTALFVWIIAINLI